MPEKSDRKNKVIQVQIPPGVHRALRIEAACYGRTMREVVQHALLVYTEEHLPDPKAHMASDMPQAAEAQGEVDHA